MRTIPALEMREYILLFGFHHPRPPLVASPLPEGGQALPKTPGGEIGVLSSDKTEWSHLLPLGFGAPTRRLMEAVLAFPVRSPSTSGGRPLGDLVKLSEHLKCAF